MARSPSPAAAGADRDAGTDTGDDTSGMVDPGDGGDDGRDSGGIVLVTITQGADGGYVVYAGDEPDAGGGDAGDGGI